MRPSWSSCPQASAVCMSFVERARHFCPVRCESPFFLSACSSAVIMDIKRNSKLRLIDSSSPRWNSVALHATLWNERWRVQRTHRQRRPPKNSRAKRRPDPTETSGTRISIRIRIRKRQRAERERRRKNGGIRIRIRRTEGGKRRRKKTAEKDGGERMPE
jgi:hypothetical protein